MLEMLEFTEQRHDGWILKVTGRVCLLEIGAVIMVHVMDCVVSGRCSTYALEQCVHDNVVVCVHGMGM